MTISFNAEARLRAIAANAIREAMLVYGRWDRPFTDDDAVRIDNIFHILHLADPSESFDHAPLSASDREPSVEAQMRQIANLLEQLPDGAASANSILEDSAVKATLPKPTKKAIVG